MPSPRTGTRLRGRITEGRQIPWWPEWTVKARCRGLDPDIFFELGPSGRTRKLVQRAKRICSECPVRRLCLRDNLLVPYGVFGGMTPGERLRIFLQKTGESSSCEESSEKYLKTYRLLEQISLAKNGKPQLGILPRASQKHSRDKNGKFSQKEEAYND